MNFKVNNISFGAQYSVYGKQSVDKTNKVYDNEIIKRENQRRIATQAQEYFESPQIQNYIEHLPEDTFVRLHTSILDGENERDDKILDFMPFVSFETKSLNEQINISRELDGGDTLELSLNGFGVLNKKPINEFFENLLEFYTCQK